jgi:hypothetical protein
MLEMLSKALEHYTLLLCFRELNGCWRATLTETCYDPDPGETTDVIEPALLGVLRIAKQEPHDLRT